MSDERTADQINGASAKWAYVIGIVVVVAVFLFVNRSLFAETMGAMLLIAWSFLALALLGLVLSTSRMKALAVCLGLAAVALGVVGWVAADVPGVVAAASVPLAIAFAVRAFAPSRVVGGVTG